MGAGSGAPLGLGLGEPSGHPEEWGSPMVVPQGRVAVSHVPAVHPTLGPCRESARSQTLVSATSNAAAGTICDLSAGREGEKSPALLAARWDGVGRGTSKEVDLSFTRRGRAVPWDADEAGGECRSVLWQWGVTLLVPHMPHCSQPSPPGMQEPCWPVCFVPFTCPKSHP